MLNNFNEKNGGVYATRGFDRNKCYRRSANRHKARLDRDNVLGWLKTVAGFANANGGSLYIGAEDKSHKLLGFELNDADKERNFLTMKLISILSHDLLLKSPFLTIKSVINNVLSSKLQLVFHLYALSF